MTLYRHSKGLDFKSMESELGEVLTNKGMEILRNHPIFTMEEWLSIIDHIEQSCPAFFRMIGRVEEDIGAGRPATSSDIIFEVVSAFGTVGLSRGITAALTEEGKAVLCVVMFVGRVGSMTFLLSVVPRARQVNYTYPTEYIVVG